jgi:hypothetical protein
MQMSTQATVIWWAVFSLPAVHPEVTKDGLLNMVYSFTMCLSWSFTWFVSSFEM